MTFEPIGPDEIRRISDAAFGLDGVDGVEVLFVHEWGGLTRFAGSVIHQSTSREDTGLRVRVVSDGRIGVTATNEFSEEGAAQAARSAKEMAEVSAPDPLFPGLAPRAETREKSSFDEATAATTPEQRAEAVAALAAQAPDGFRAAGSFETTAAEVALSNTEGQFCYAPTTHVAITALVSGGDQGAGYVEAWSTATSDVDLEAVGRRAAQKARDSQNPRDLEARRYEVVLEPAAVATLVAFLSYMGFSGRALVEGRSCLSGKGGQRVGAEAVTIRDDALAAGAPGIPFDFEGTPRQRVDIIRDGVFVDGVYDRRSARQAGRESTGHALPPPNPQGPFPLNLVMEPGDASLEQMIGATELGLLVTRFHYSNVVNPMESILTGMTRDGTWLIENGEIRYPVKNFRFTQSILEALQGVELVGKDTEMVTEFFFSASRVPAIKVSSFNFTGRSDH
jgi:predicted Zn-dependent protease